MAYKYDAPVVPCVLTYRERIGIYKLFGKKDAYGINLCSRRLGSLLPARSVLLIDPQDVVSGGDIAAYYISPNEVKIISVREDDNGKFYGMRWNPDERIELNNDDLSNLHKVIAIYL